MSKPLPSRPDLDHLRRQAKQLLARLQAGDAAAASELIAHLPEARGMSAKQVLAAGYRLADAQSAVARRSGFTNWPALGRHVQQLRALEGEWRFESLEVEGAAVPAAMLANSRILIDGDRFRTDSPEAVYEGEFVVDVERDPAHIDIEFVAGPEAGRWSYGVYTLDGDQLRICLGLAGSARPEGFVTRPGSGHALESLVRASRQRPENVNGGERKPRGKVEGASPPAADPATFASAPSELTRSLEGEWQPLELVLDGKPMPAAWLGSGKRVVTGDELRVVFGGQTMVHARVRFDESVSPVGVDYLYLSGEHAGRVAHGIMDWQGPEARFLIAPPGQSRPVDWTCASGSGRTLSRWKKR